MQTVAAPASIRDQAFGICRAFGLDTSKTRTLIEAGGADCLCAVLVELEARFRIDLEVDEIWRGATVADLVALVERKVNDKHRRALIPSNDDFPAQPEPFRVRRPIFPPPNARELRDRARRARRVQARREIVHGVSRVALGAGVVSGLSALALGVFAIFGWA